LKIFRGPLENQSLHFSGGSSPENENFDFQGANSKIKSYI